MYFFPSDNKDVYKSSLAIVIPKIHAASPIVTNVNAWDKNDYLPQLKNGVAHAKGTAVPGGKGVSLIFAHSSDYPWNITRYNTAFFRLNELRADDKLFVLKNGERIDFVVEKTVEVSPYETQFLKEKGDYLVLQTCTPIGTDWKRLLIFAKRI